LSGRARVIALASRAAELLVEPVEADLPPGAVPIVCVVGLGPRCGCTTVARALARLLGAPLMNGGADALDTGSSHLERPLVMEVPHGEPPAVPASVADLSLLVAGPAVEPALAAAAAQSLARVCARSPLVVVWGGHRDRWEGVADVLLPRAPGAARLARAGLPVAGPLGRGLAELSGRVRMAGRRA
jgi:hypothetical protein